MNCTSLSYYHKFESLDRMLELLMIITLTNYIGQVDETVLFEPVANNFNLLQFIPSLFNFNKISRLQETIIV